MTALLPQRPRRAAVIGGGLGGMTAAGELAAAGCAVTLFEGGSALGGKAAAIHEGGFTLDTGPTLLTLPHVVRAGFRRLGAEDLLPRFIELEEQCVYHFADGSTFTAHRKLEKTLASAAQLGPEEASGLLDFYEEAAAIYRAAGEPYLEAPMMGAGDYLQRVARRGISALLRGARMGTLAGLAEHHLHSAQLRQFAGRFATYAGASPYQASAAFALIPHVERAFGVHHVEGGMGALSAALARAIARLGVDVRLQTTATWHRDGRRFAAGPAGAEEPFDSVVVNADPLATLGRTHEPLALSGYVLLLAARRRVPLPHHSVVFARDYRAEFDELFAGRVPEELTLYVCHPAATDSTLAPPDQSGLFLMVNAPALREDSADGWTGHAAKLRAFCLSRLLQLCPALSASDIQVLAERTPVDLARRGAPGGSIYGFLPHGRLGPLRRPRIRGNVPGLFFSGGGTHPGGGVPLVMLSGHFAAELAAQHLGVTG